MALNENLKTHLTKVHELTKPKGFTFLNPKSPMVSNLLASGHLEADHGTVNPSDAAKVAMRVSDAGKAEIGATALPGPETDPGSVITGVTDAPAEKKAGTGPRGPRIRPVIAAGRARMALPEVTRGGNFGQRPETYPFSALEPPIEDADGTKLHDSFFVHATATNPNPAKTLAGTVSSATKRFKEENRKFSVISVENDSVHNAKGARVFRIA